MQLKDSEINFSLRVQYIATVSIPAKTPIRLTHFACYYWICSALIIHAHDIICSHFECIFQGLLRINFAAQRNMNELNLLPWQFSGLYFARTSFSLNQEQWLMVGAICSSRKQSCRINRSPDDVHVLAGILFKFASSSWLTIHCLFVSLVFLEGNSFFGLSDGSLVNHPSQNAKCSRRLSITKNGSLSTKLIVDVVKTTFSSMPIHTFSWEAFKKFNKFFLFIDSKHYYTRTDQ